MADPTITPPPANPPQAPAKPTAAPAAPPDRIKGRLTRQGMEKAIRSGGSVLHDGKSIVRIEDLPSEAEISQGDETAENAARAGIEERQAVLDRERAILDTRRAKANQPTPPKK